MRRTFSLMIAISVLLIGLGTACPSGDGSASSSGAAASSTGKGIVGTWKIAKAEGSMASTNEGTVYEFGDDGKFVLGGMTKGDYTTEGGKVTLKYAGMDMEQTATYELSEGDSKMVYKLEGSDQVFHMERQ